MDGVRGAVYAGQGPANGCAVLLRGGDVMTWGAGNPRAGIYHRGATGHGSVDDVLVPSRVVGVSDAAGCALEAGTLAVVERSGLVKVCGCGDGDALGQGNEEDALSLFPLSGRALTAPT